MRRKKNPLALPQVPNWKRRGRQRSSLGEGSHWPWYEGPHPRPSPKWCSIAGVGFSHCTAAFPVYPAGGRGEVTGTIGC